MERMLMFRNQLHRTARATRDISRKSSAESDEKVEKTKVDARSTVR